MAPAVPAFELPPWQQLVFEQRNFWATARGELNLKKGVAPLFPESGTEPFVRLEIQNTVGSSIESIVVDLAIHRERIVKLLAPRGGRGHERLAPGGQQVGGRRRRRKLVTLT